MKFTQPKLPYPPDALEPVISQQTVEYHYGKHEKGYIDTLNSLISGTPFEDMSLERIICESDGKLFNNAAQAWNHIFYFFQFSADGPREPNGELRKAIDRDFGSFCELKTKMQEAGTSLFGSGWVWLSCDTSGKLFITQGGNAGNPMTDRLKPLLAIDVWEHAYYLDYQNLRADYLKHIWDIIDWDLIELRYS